MTDNTADAVETAALQHAANCQPPQLRSAPSEASATPDEDDKGATLFELSPPMAAQRQRLKVLTAPEPRVGPSVALKAHQRVIRETEAEKGPRPTLANLDGCYVEAITTEAAKAVILRYEWLGTMGRAVATYGLRGADGDLLGVAAFGWPSAIESRDVCGREYREQAVCLERGACVHYAPSNAASFLITHALRQASADHGWKIFYAYADPEAGEIGTVYQACNWLYIGQGVGRTPGRLREDWRLPDGKVLSSRSLRHRGMKRRDALEAGWVPVPKHPKHKYVQFVGTKPERAALRQALRYSPQPYPKRLAVVPTLDTRSVPVGFAEPVSPEGVA